MDTVKDRLVYFIHEAGLSVREFERTIGVSNGYIKALRKSPTTGKMRSIIDNYPQLNREWLETGTGPMLVGGTGQKKENLIPPSNAIPSIEITEYEYAGENKNGGIFFRDQTGKLYISVPHVSFSARGEYPNFSEDLEPMEDQGREIYAVDRKASGRYISFDVRGDSMDNGSRKSLQDGDKILVRELERDNWRTLRTGDHRFWVIVFGASVLVKEISGMDSSKGVLTCHSLNPSPEYNDFQVPMDSVRHLFYVIKVKPKEFDGI